MVRYARLFAIVAVALGASQVARADVLWHGDYSTGDISQWSGGEIANPDRLTVVPDPMGSKQMVLKTKVVEGDNPTHSVGGNRNELVYQEDRPKEGEDRYYRWQTYWPKEYKSGDKWQIFTQWHQYVTGGSPPLAFLVWGEQIRLGTPATYHWTAPFERGKWHDFIFHVKWASDGQIGGVELWYDGDYVLPFTHDKTLFPHDTVYLKQGIYRSAQITNTEVIYHHGMVVGTKLEDVNPPVPAAPPAASGTSSTDSSQAGLANLPPGSSVLAKGGAGCESAGLPGALPAGIAVGSLLLSRLTLRRRARRA